MKSIRNQYVKSSMSNFGSVCSRLDADTKAALLKLACELKKEQLAAKKEVA